MCPEWLNPLNCPRSPSQEHQKSLSIHSLLHFCPGRSFYKDPKKQKNHLAHKARAERPERSHKSQQDQEGWGDLGEYHWSLFINEVLGLITSLWFNTALDFYFILYFIIYYFIFFNNILFYSIIFLRASSPTHRSIFSAPSPPCDFVWFFLGVYSRGRAGVLPVFNVVIILLLLRYHLREIQKLSASGEGWEGFLSFLQCLNKSKSIPVLSSGLGLAPGTTAALGKFLDKTELRRRGDVELLDKIKLDRRGMWNCWIKLNLAEGGCGMAG